jgi:hypothetical protein
LKAANICRNQKTESTLENFRRAMKRYEMLNGIIVRLMVAFIVADPVIQIKWLFDFFYLNYNYDRIA